MTPLTLKLHWQIPIAQLLGVIVGLVAGQDTAGFGQSRSIFELIGNSFLHALKMRIAPVLLGRLEGERSVLEKPLA